MTLFVFEKSSASLPKKENLEQVKELANCPVVIAFPSMFTFGTIYRVVPYEEREYNMIRRLVGDPDHQGFLTMDDAIRDCVGKFLLEREATIRRWRLFVNGRAYGSAFPPVKNGKIPTEMDIVDNVKYWLDFDAGFYR